MRKINISNDSKRDAEVAFGSTFRREKPVYKTSTGSVGKNERRLKVTMPTTDMALLAKYGDTLSDVLFISVESGGAHKSGGDNVRADIYSRNMP